MDSDKLTTLIHYCFHEDVDEDDNEASKLITFYFLPVSIHFSHGFSIQCLEIIIIKLRLLYFFIFEKNKRFHY